MTPLSVSLSRSLFLNILTLYNIYKKCLGWLRGFIADYGVPLMILVWTGVSYIPSGSVPKGIPRRLFSPNPWSPGAYENWTVIKAGTSLAFSLSPSFFTMLTSGFYCNGSPRTFNELQFGSWSFTK